MATLLLCLKSLLPSSFSPYLVCFSYTLFFSFLLLISLVLCELRHTILWRWKLETCVNKSSKSVHMCVCSNKVEKNKILLKLSRLKGGKRHDCCACYCAVLANDCQHANRKRRKDEEICLCGRLCLVEKIKSLYYWKKVVKQFSTLECIFISKNIIKISFKISILALVWIYWFAFVCACVLNQLTKQSQSISEKVFKLLSILFSF